MAAQLYARAPVFREEIDRCVALLEHDLPSIGELLLSPKAAGINDTAHAQPALFAVCWALARQWIAWGVQPAAMIGHSLGELVAASVAEVMVFLMPCALVTVRGRLMQAARPGSMLAVALGETRLRALLPANLSLAAVNGPQACVVAGPAQCTVDFAGRLGKDGVATATLATSHAFHSADMDEALCGNPRAHADAGVARAADPIRLKRQRQLDFGARGNESGLLGAPDAPTCALFRRTCHLAGGRSHGPAGSRARSGPLRLGAIPSRPYSARAGGKLYIAASEWRGFAACLEAIGTLWAAGITPRWAAVNTGPRRRVELPPYAFSIGATGSILLTPDAQTNPGRRRRGAAGAAFGDDARSGRLVSGDLVAAAVSAGVERLPPSPLLIFADDFALSAGVIAQAHGAVVVSASDAGGDAARRIDPADEPQWRRLIADLVASGRAPATIL